MPKVDLIATKDFKYNTRRLLPGDAFQASHETDARILTKVRKVAELPAVGTPEFQQIANELLSRGVAAPASEPAPKETPKPAAKKAPAKRKAPAKKAAAKK